MSIEGALRSSVAEWDRGIRRARAPIARLQPPALSKPRSAMALRRHALVVTLALAMRPAVSVAQGPSFHAPNTVAVSATLVTSGQPTAQALQRLGDAGFQAVIYLAPRSVPDAVAEEPEIVRRQGIEFVHIPIPF